MAQEGWGWWAIRTIKCNRSSTFQTFHRPFTIKIWKCPGSQCANNPPPPTTPRSNVKRGRETNMGLLYLQPGHCLSPDPAPQKNGHLRV